MKKFNSSMAKKINVEYYCLFTSKPHNIVIIIIIITKKPQSQKVFPRETRHIIHMYISLLRNQTNKVNARINWI